MLKHEISRACSDLYLFAFGGASDSRRFHAMPNQRLPPCYSVHSLLANSRGNP